MSIAKHLSAIALTSLFAFSAIAQIVQPWKPTVVTAGKIDEGTQDPIVLRAQTLLAPQVADNAALIKKATAAYDGGVFRADYAAGLGAPPLFYKPSNSACSLNSGAGDDATQVRSADGKCWIASFPAVGMDVREFGADPTGVSDSAPAFNAASAARGYDGQPLNVIIPNGHFQLKEPISLSSTDNSRCFIGNGWSSQIIVGPQFDRLASGVIIPTANTNSWGSGLISRPCLHNIRITFEQPADLQVTTSGTNAVGQNKLVLSSISGVKVGMVVVDANNAIPNSENAKSLSTATVRSVNSTTHTITISTNLTATIGGGDLVSFTPPRSSFTTLSQGCSLSAGASFCKYPWAVFAAGGVNNIDLDNILIEGAFNGVYIRGSTFKIGTLQVGALGVGLDIDDCYNFPVLNAYTFYTWGFGYPTNPAQTMIYYDGVAVAANLGRTDGIAADVIASWVGAVNVTNNWTFGQISHLEMDGSNANLNIVPNNPGAEFLQIGEFYSSKGSQTYGDAVYIAPTSESFFTSFNSFWLSYASAYNPGIQASNGNTSILNAYMWDGIQNDKYPMINIHGGNFMIDNAILSSSSNQTNAYFIATNSVVQLGHNVTFQTPPGRGANGLINAGGATPLLDIGVNWNGWAKPPRDLTLNGAIGVSCHGAPTSSFTSVNGIVTHC